MIFDLKIMCDGAFDRTTQKGAIGVIVYDSEGRVVDGRARSFFCRAPICAKAIAILEALHMGRGEQRTTQVITDCMALTSALQNNEDAWPWKAAATLARIKQMLEANPQVHLRYVPRTEVHTADRIAKMAHDDRLPLDWLSDI
ncbi:hypothetical protein LINPERHAP2_LOCUS24030 [Linum perenne]